MAEKYDLIIKGGTVVDQSSARLADIAVSNERIAAIGDLAGASAERQLDATGLHILPGLIDTHVHFREPGAEFKEDLETGSRAAIFGGVTAVFDMPDNSPPVTSAEAIKQKITKARSRMWCDFAVFVGATLANNRAMTWLEKVSGVCGVRFATGAAPGDLLIADDGGIFDVLRHGSRRVSVHCEDEIRLQSRAGERIDGDVASHSVWRDVDSALEATDRVIQHARRTGRRVHIEAVSSAEQLALLAEHKDVASIAVTPQHLTLAAPDCYDQMGSRAQMNPPIRDARHGSALWRGLADGSIDILASAHSPHTLEEKSKSYPATPSGMPGVQTLLPVMLSHVAAGRLSLSRLVDLTSAGPQRLFGLRDKGRLAVGYHADLVLVDMAREWEICDQWIASRVSWTPFHGYKATGAVKSTVLRGHVVMEDGRMAPTARGKPIRFTETMRGELVDFD